MSMHRFMFALLLCSSSVVLAEPVTVPPTGQVLGETCDDAQKCVSTLRCKDGTCQEPLITYPTYKVLHVVAGLSLFFFLGGLCAMAWSESLEKKRLVRMLLIAHGVLLLFVLAGGFGLMARLGVAHGSDWPLWLKLKLGVWLLVGAFPVLPRRVPKYTLLWAGLALGLAAMAVNFAVNKPL